MSNVFKSLVSLLRVDLDKESVENFNVALSEYLSSCLEEHEKPGLTDEDKTARYASLYKGSGIKVNCKTIDINDKLVSVGFSSKIYNKINTLMELHLVVEIEYVRDADDYLLQDIYFHCFWICPNKQKANMNEEIKNTLGTLNPEEIQQTGYFLEALSCVEEMVSKNIISTMNLEVFKANAERNKKLISKFIEISPKNVIV